MRVIDFFDRGVAINPNVIALEDAKIGRSYGEVQERTYRFANAITAEGYGRDKMAGVYSPNCVSGLEVMLGLFRAGTIWVPVNAKNGDTKIHLSG